MEVGCVGCVSDVQVNIGEEMSSVDVSVLDKYWGDLI